MIPAGNQGDRKKANRDSEIHIHEEAPDMSWLSFRECANAYLHRVVQMGLRKCHNSLVAGALTPMAKLPEQFPNFKASHAMRRFFFPIFPNLSKHEVFGYKY